MDYKEELRRIMEIEGLNSREMSEKLGMSYGYFRNMMMPSEIRVVIWMKAFVEGYKLNKD